MGFRHRVSKTKHDCWVFPAVFLYHCRLASAKTCGWENPVGASTKPRVITDRSIMCAGTALQPTKDRKWETPTKLQDSLRQFGSHSLEDGCLVTGSLRYRWNKHPMGCEAQLA